MIRTTITVVAIAALCAIVTAVPAQSPPTTKPVAAIPKAKETASKSDFYTLATCPVTEKPLGAQGGVARVIDGREVRFCCDACPDRFKADSKAMFAKIDEELIRQQQPYFPSTTCLIMDEPLVEDGEDIAVEFTHGNRLVRLCCPMCKRRFEKNPGRYLAKLETAARELQAPKYPLTECLVGGRDLHASGEPVELFVGGRLVRLCCEGCVEPFKQQPAKYLKILDDAWKAAGGPPKAVAIR